MDPFILLVEIMIINMVLSGDNAVVIAMASKNLPERQRKKAIWWGAAGAILLRIGLTVVAIILLKVPLLQASGALLLMYIAFKLLNDDHDHTQVRQKATLWSAVWTIIVADVIMSLDNVLAIAAITKGHMPMLIFGVGMSLPLIVWGSRIIVSLLNRFPILIVIGAAILGLTAGEMFISDPKIREVFALAHQSIHWVVPLFCTSFILFFGLYQNRSKNG